MTRQSRTSPAKPPHVASIWTALVLLGFLVCAFGILSLILIHNHAWTDQLLARLPMPGSKTSLAADTGLINQMRTKRASARITQLADQETTLVIEAAVTNDALIPVTRLVVEATAYVEGNAVESRSSHCGRIVSERLLNRLRREELDVLLDVESPAARQIRPGDEILCQLTLSGPVATQADEIGLRVASVEPLPGHRFPRFASSE